MHTTSMRRYTVVVEGTLDPAWSDSMGGLTITTCLRPPLPPVTRLTGMLVDQGALHGVLNTLFMLDLPLLLVECEAVEP